MHFVPTLHGETSLINGIKLTRYSSCTCIQYIHICNAWSCTSIIIFEYCASELYTISHCIVIMYMHVCTRTSIYMYTSVCYIILCVYCMQAYVRY